MADYDGPDTWAMDEEGDLCRVCRSEAEESKPLIYPCKCSGSVRYVHSDCLQEWLSHSRKRYCEICGHYYSFTKVYPSSLPSAIPAIVYVRQSLLVAGRVAWQAFRVCLAIVSWLVILPCVTMSSLRVILAGADYISFPWVSYGILNAKSDSLEDLQDAMALENATWVGVNATGRDRVLQVIATNSSFSSVLPRFTERMSDDAKNLVAFVFRGQIVAISIAAGLIGLILLREWIGQLDWHTRAAPEEEGEPKPEDWMFRNGQALRMVDLPAYPFASLGEAQADATAADIGDADTVMDVRDDEGGDQEAFDAHSTSTTTATAAPDGQSNFVDHHLPDDQADHVAADTLPAPISGPSDWPQRGVDSPFDPSELNNLVREIQERDRQRQLAASASASGSGSGSGSSSRPTADVPVDAVGGSPGPSNSRLVWPRGASVDASEAAETTDYLSSREVTPLVPGQDSPGDDDDHEELETVATASGAPESSPDFRRASDPGFGSPSLAQRVERQYGSQGLPLELRPDDELQPRPEVDVDAYDTHTQTPAREDVGRLFDRQLEGTTPYDSDSGSAALNTPPTGDHARTDTEQEDLDTDADPEGDGDGDGDGDHDGGDAEPDDEDHIPDPIQGAERLAEFMEIDGVGVDIDEDEDGRPLDADDWDGIFEVVGFIGPLTGLLHNHVFVSFAMACTLFILVGLPVVIGKFVLATDIIRFVGDFFVGALFVITIAVDTIIDLLATVVEEVLTLPRLLTKPAQDWVVQTLDLPALEFNLAALLFGHGGDAIAAVNGTATELPPIVEAAATHVLNGFELVGGMSYHLYKVVRLVAISIAASPDAVDQFWCIVVGYVSIALGVVCVAIADAAGVLQLSDNFREKAHTVQVFMKVIFFMTLEIVAFPLFVGFIIDLSLMSLFGQTIGGRIQRLSTRPFGTLFIGWLTGTIFMFSFATFLAHIRTLCRKGALYFVRDPSDPSHSPVKDIMERPAMAQIPRLAISACMYSMVVFAVCGLVPAGLSILGYFSNAFKNFLPLQLEQRPLSSVPFDLLFLHLILPPSWEDLRVYHRSKKGLKLWWDYTVRRLELSSLILGPETGHAPMSKTEQMSWLVLDAICQALFGHYDARATRARVPNNDRVELLPIHERRRDGMFIPLDHKGAPTTEADRVRLLRQDRAARRVGRNPLKDYTVVTLPDYWRTRVHVLLVLGLLSAATVTASLFFIPLAVGRQTTSLIFDEPIFDGYNWLVGGYICWGSYSLGDSTKRRIVMWSRAGRLRRSPPSARAKRSVFSAARCTYSVFVLYFLLPLLIGVNFELFISLPARYGFSSDLTPVLHVWDAWAMGTALISMFVGAVGIARHEENGLDLPFGQRFRHAFRRPLRQSLATINGFLLPIVLWLVVPIVLPWAFLLSLCTGLKLIGVPLPNVDNNWVFRMMYPFTSAGMIVLACWAVISDILKRVRQWMIDAEYVLEERVENYEPAADPADPGSLTPVTALRRHRQLHAHDEDDWEDVVIEVDV